MLDTSFFQLIFPCKHYSHLFQVTMVVMSFLTNCLVVSLGEDCSGEGAIVQSLMAIFSGQGGVFAFCQSYPTIRCFISPPNVRNKPHWYPRFRPIILRVLQQIMLGRPLNLQLLEDHPGELDPNGVHFNIMSGVTFVQDLHDQAVQLAQQAPPDTQIRLKIFYVYPVTAIHGIRQKPY